MQTKRSNSAVVQAQQKSAILNDKQYEDFVKAIFAERAAWFGVANSLPGTPTHDPKKWDEWISKVQELIRVPEQHADRSDPVACQAMWRGAVAAYRHKFLNGSCDHELKELGAAAQFWHGQYKMLLGGQTRMQPHQDGTTTKSPRPTVPFSPDYTHLRGFTATAVTAIREFTERRVTVADT